jgi:hypothetical protein
VGQLRSNEGQVRPEEAVLPWTRHLQLESPTDNCYVLDNCCIAVHLTFGF